MLKWLLIIVISGAELPGGHMIPALEPVIKLLVSFK